MKTACRHCGGTRRPMWYRGLCWKCYREPGVRESYPKAKPGPKPGARKPDLENDLTEEEVEAIVACQLEALPEWWWKDVERMRRRDGR